MRVRCRRPKPSHSFVASRTGGGPWCANLPKHPEQVWHRDERIMNFAATAIGRTQLDTEISGYLLENAWHRSQERLVLQEQFADPATRRRIAALGSMCRWHCL